MNENKYYLKVNNRTVAECVSLEYALIFIKSIFENYYNDHDIVISIACGIFGQTHSESGNRI